jgi:predicted neuraminidase
MRTVLTLLAFAAALLVPVRAEDPSGRKPPELPETCFLFAYFYHDKEGEGFRLAWSADGYRFEKLADGRSLLRPTAGENKLMRDPHLLRGPDGLYHLVWTTGWTGKTIGYASSKDLITWSEQKTLPVMEHEPDAQNCWAPEMVWDDAKKHYLIFWSSTILGRFKETEMSNKRPERNHRIYSTTTTDFKTFTPTKLMYDGGYNVIDANLLQVARGEWLMFVKNETVQPKTEKNIRMIRGKSAEGPWGQPSAPLTGAYWAEGPAAIKVGAEYRVYFDKHMLNAIGMVRSRDLKSWEDVSDKVSFPANARHGCIVAVPREEMKRIIQHPHFRSDASQSPAVTKSEFIFETAPYPSCHASTIVETSAGALVAAWFGGTHERNPDVGIWVSRQENGRWTEGVEVANGVQENGSREPTWNPVLFQAPKGPLVLFYKVGPSPSKWWGMVMESADGGKTWSKPRRLPDGILGPIKNKPVVLADGTWLSPTSTEGNPEGWLTHFEWSKDAGKTWQKSESVKQGPAGFDAIQGSILFHPGGKLQTVVRTRQGVVGQTWSSDGGRTWTPITAIDLPNPNSGTDAVTLKDGRHLIVYNHSGHRAEEAKGDRWPLDVAISKDGLHWTRVLTLETEPNKAGYAYPAVIQTSDGLVHITYTWDRRRIKHVVVDPGKL